MAILSINKIIAFEQGELGFSDTLDLFGVLIGSGLAYRLQGFYGRTANDLIESGLLTPTGERTEYADVVAELSP